MRGIRVRLVPEPGFRLFTDGKEISSGLVDDWRRESGFGGSLSSACPGSLWFSE